MTIENGVVGIPEEYLPISTILERLELNPNRLAGDLCPTCGEWMDLVVDRRSGTAMFYCKECLPQDAV